VRKFFDTMRKNRLKIPFRNRDIVKIKMFSLTYDVNSHVYSKSKFV